MGHGWISKCLCAVCLSYAVSSGDSWVSGSGRITTSSTSTKVGIGVRTGVNPGAKLEVAGGDILISNNKYLQAKSSNCTVTNLLGLTSADALNIGSGSRVSSLNFFTAGTSRMVVNSSGRVGINTSSPGERLDVKGDIIIRGNNWGSGEDAIIYLGDYCHYIKSTWGEGVRIATNRVPDAVVIREVSGCVGIGTAVLNPDYRLNVAGQGLFTSNNTGNRAIVRAEYSNASFSPKYKSAIEGVFYKEAGYGIGASFYGGYAGVIAEANLPGKFTKYGGLFDARQGSGMEYENFGTISYAEAGKGAYALGALGNASSKGGAGGASAYGVVGKIPDPGPERGPLDWAGYFLGRVYTTETFQPSDDTLKTNIANMGSVLDKVKKLQPVTYEFDYKNYPNFGLSDTKQHGLLAKDLESQFPDLVAEFESIGNAAEHPANALSPATPHDTTKYKCVNYIALIPILIKAIQEQQEEIDRLRERVESR